MNLLVEVLNSSHADLGRVMSNGKYPYKETPRKYLIHIPQTNVL